eukprot:jgi/Ulvmu1/11489/UM077_0038.1
MGSLLIECVRAQLQGLDGLPGQVQAVCAVALLGLGLATAVKSSSAALRFFWRQYLRPGKKLSKYGQWAIVTGATDGIGRAYCDQLAKQGMSIYLVSRTESKLKQAADEISQKYGVETKYYAADLADAGKESIDQSCWYGLKSNINGMDIGVLINNAGMSHDHPQFFSELDPAEVDNMIAINCTAVAKMTYIVLPGMVERGRGAILNIGSASATGIPASPFISLYGGTKAFVDTFSRSLSAEVKSKGIDVQCQGPALIATKLAKVRPSIMSPSPETYTGYGVRFIGYEPTAVAYPVHAFQQFMVMHVLPKQLSINMVYDQLKAVRAKALKKKAAAAKDQ